MFHSVLVANRGEIALRVFRTCRDLGIRTIAIHSEADTDAPHVREADVAVAVASYLDVDAVVAAAKEAGAEAVHPGYGFLSERAAFAAAVRDAGLAWIGPDPDVIERMGRKDAAREIAIAAEVPVVPSYDVGDDPAGFAYPILVKAAAGGGGKGMRIVRSVEEYADAVASARREATSAFGDDTMLIEKYVERGRHIEVQVMADGHGTVLHLFERDCSTQRRHQKVLEEAPAPTLTDTQRELVTSSAVALAREVGYTGAGTVEFLLDDVTGEAYFLEMNTRLQVEHPVTEATVRIGGQGLDLVALQLRVAGGRPLGIAQEDVTTTGHAIEARVYAEDPYAGFLPQAGTAKRVHWPAAARVDHALEDGQVVSTSYDPMLGKVIVHGPDREAARIALVRALDDTAVLGLTTNTGFLRELAASTAFRDAEIDTAWLDRNELAPPDPAAARELAAWAWHRRHGEHDGPFRSDGFRMGAAPAPIVVELDEPVTLARPPAARPVAVVDEHGVELAHHGQRYVFNRPDVAADHGAGAGEAEVTAPMPGTVLTVDVAVGDTVAAGQRLGVMEAMKMELTLEAPYDGTVAAVTAAVGQQVALGATLFEVEEG
jgi:acetyl-CoA/propionyl-CoA carboxylase, biotin carboxylase, biotin carboxyl carrier protein